MDFKRKAQIEAQSGVQVGASLFDNVFTEVSAKYFNYNHKFSVKNIAELPKNIRINEHAIELEEG